MKQNSQSLIETALFTAKQAFARLPIFIQGDKTFVFSALENIRPLAIVSNDATLNDVILWRNAKQWLGQELGSVLFDLRDEIDAEKLCALIGCIKGGNLVFFWLENTIFSSPKRFDQRLVRFINEEYTGFISANAIRAPRFALYENIAHADIDHLSLPTEDQKRAIEGVKKVLYGHRRRPLFLIADRGRGKSSALGIAAGKIMQEAKKKILVTSPTVLNSRTLFTHTALECALVPTKASHITLTNGSELNFIAPDTLLFEKPQCDLLLVDEAAAIPLPMLNQIIQHYSRVVFSSTEHGYEGTGRGFSNKFRELLKEKKQHKQEIKLTQPIRFVENCPLERLLYAVFLFDHEPVIPTTGVVNYQKITQKQLLEDEPLLKQLFALLITAHYQTSPNDLLQLLDSENAVLIGAFVNQVLVAIVYATKEGNFEQELALKIAKGERRIKGHLLPQSLAQHTGTAEILSNTILRITRLAVLPLWQNQGIGTKLIEKLEQHCKENAIDLIGTSFSAEEQLLNFWLKQHYSPVRIGVQKDAASGQYSLQLLKSLTAEPNWLVNLKTLFSQNMQYQITSLYKDLPPSLAAKLFSCYQKSQKPSEAVFMQVKNYADGMLGSELIGGSLYQYYRYWLSKKNINAETSLDAPIKKMVFAYLIQQHSWQNLAREYGFSGRREIENQIRRWIKEQLTLHNS